MGLIVSKKLHPEPKAKLVAALRSGKYDQGRGALCRVVPGADGEDCYLYCCLGVASKVFSEETGHEGFTDTIDLGIHGGSLPGRARRFGGGWAYMPSVVAEWLGAEGNDLIVEYEGRPTRLSNLNDQAVPFPIIADLVDEQL